MTAAVDTQNGHARGRAVPPERLEEFVFQGSGRTVQIRKVSALLREEVRRQVKREFADKEPPPPLVEVDYGNGKLLIPHKGHEVYQRLLAEWEAEITNEAGERIKRLAVKRGVVCEVEQDEVARVRAELEEEGVNIAEQSDLWVYVAYVCVGPYDDWMDLLRAIFERSAPSEEAVQAHIATFPNNVRREGSVASEPGPAAGETPVEG